MKQHPILMKGPLVLQTMADQKTQTRRLTGLDEINKDPERWEFVRFFNGYAKFCEKHNHTNEVYVKCPYGQPEDILWVRETWCIIPHGPDSFGPYLYKSMGDEPYGKWKPSIHMPKSACRLWLQITDIRVERLNEISEEDAKAEGVEPNCAGAATCPSPKCAADGCQSAGEYFHYMRDFDDFPAFSAKESFESLWAKINGPDSWQANPFVWVISFKKIDKPS